MKWFNINIGRPELQWWSTTPNTTNERLRQICVWACRPSLKDRKTNVQLTQWSPAGVFIEAKCFLHRHVVTCWQIITFKPASAAMSPRCYSEVVHAVYVATCLPPRASIHASVAATCILKVRNIAHTSLLHQLSWTSNSPLITTLMCDIILIRQSSTEATDLSPWNGKAHPFFTS